METINTINQKLKKNLGKKVMVAFRISNFNSDGVFLGTLFKQQKGYLVANGYGFGLFFIVDGIKAVNIKSGQITIIDLK